MSKEDTSPYISMLNDVKNEILKQLQNTEASIKQQFCFSIEETNSKLSNLTNTVKENSEKISNIEERLSKTEKEPPVSSYSEAVINGEQSPVHTNTMKKHTESKHEPGKNKCLTFSWTKIYSGGSRSDGNHSILRCSPLPALTPLCGCGTLKRAPASTL